MKHSAEIFDLVQYLFDTTGFNDHQLHCVIKYKNKVNAAIMEKAFRLLIDAVPILSRVYRDHGGNSYWEDTSEHRYPDLFSVVDNAKAFDAFTFSKTSETAGPQIKGCLLFGKSDALSIVMNHMVTDGAGMKECACLLSQIYSGLIKDPAYKPDFVIDGIRSYNKVLTGLRLQDRLGILFFRGKDNNSSGDDTFPLSDGRCVQPFICTHALTPEKLRDIIAFSKQNNATVNDVILTAYFRVLSSIPGLQGKTLSVPLMIDMRRYLEDKSFSALANLASTEILRIAASPGETFLETLKKVAGETAAMKGRSFGLNSFVKLYTLFKISGRGKAYKLLEKHLRNPNICITNIGVIDAGRLVFDGAEIDNAYITGSIKYRPHFQLSLSSFGDKMTLAVNLYGDSTDHEKIQEFLAQMDRALDDAAPV
ncbi:Uncharacterized protein, contains a NRPS condensation (elongation) domain [Sporobacter termitidis DSM 10068]|uniref:Uncharacterized protein, contains a NRPS condensation (Elongation) domain n=1 Tax=Sporobacter termitidis DSM 10068 TaxID=1123282 RepID=A0A1M5VL49_9FIRM|nr:hypothetical protein [Sporobacter termitidis]SHH75955.1 Uncharacterized protein, contains a NRPS condensation (elongation) domain [Sporobacter termitidis DSM 10068]